MKEGGQRRGENPTESPKSDLILTQGQGPFPVVPEDALPHTGSLCCPLPTAPATSCLISLPQAELWGTGLAKASPDVWTPALLLHLVPITLKEPNGFTSAPFSHV